jgi:PIN domain nuclease of toxin-antitoxin system
MKVILDTHIWLWYMLGDKQLPSSHREMIADENVELWLSPISIWEAHLLIERERLSIRESAAAWIKRALQLLPVREAGLTFAIARRSRMLAVSHQDPADRFIAATAIELDIPLLTADKRLKDCSDLNCID